MFATNRKDVNKHGIQVKAHARKRRYHHRNMCRTTMKQRKDIEKQVNRPLTAEYLMVTGEPTVKMHRVRKGRDMFVVEEAETDMISLLADGYVIEDTWHEWA